VSYEPPKLRLKFTNATPELTAPQPAPPPPAPPRRPQTWWQAISGAEFTTHIKELTDDELIELHAEISGAVALTAGQLNAQNGDADWIRRAKLALGYMSQKKRLTGGEMALRSLHVGIAQRSELRAAVEDALDVEDVPAAIRAIVEFLCAKDRRP
jgi:hypothetical protein